MTTEREAQIDLIVFYLKQRWLESPEQRLGQLLMNASRDRDGSTLPEYEFWNYIDDKWLDDLK